MIITGLSLLFAFNSYEFSTILFFIFISGIGSGSVYLLTISYLQSTTSENLRGRVFGNFYTIGRLSLLVSVFISGFVASFANNYLPTSIVSGLLIAFVTADSVISLNLILLGSPLISSASFKW